MPNIRLTHPELSPNAAAAAAKVSPEIRELIKRSGKKPVREYTLGEEIFNAVTHGVGAGLAVAALVLLIVKSVADGGGILLAAALVYGIAQLLEYLMSTLYHALAAERAKRVFKVLDHSGIYLLIAGSYTPICLTALKDSSGPALLAVVWGVGLVGILLTLVKLAIPRWLTSAIYLFMGWLALFAIVPIYHAMPGPGFAWLLTGGLLYTVGGVLYAVKWPGRNNPRFGCHEIFHVFILLGSIAHFIMMYQIIAFL